MYSLTAVCQEVDYKKGMIQVDGKDYAKVEVKKENFGLTKTFTVYNMAGEKIIIAAPALEFEQDKSDNTILYYRVTFLTANQVGIFKVPSLSQEKGFAKLIGQSGIVVNDKVDESKVKELIAAKSASPTVAVDYTMVKRNRAWPVRLKEDKTIEQESIVIGSFKPTGSRDGMDSYEFILPSAVVVAKVSFTGGNNAKNIEVFTLKDNFKRMVPFDDGHTVIASSAGIDKNQIILDRIAKWLMEKNYL